MANLDQVLQAAARLSPEEKELLMRSLRSGATPLAMHQFPMAAPRPHSTDWVKAERGHAVLVTDAPVSDADIPEGYRAIMGIWSEQEGK